MRISFSIEIQIVLLRSEVDAVIHGVYCERNLLRGTPNNATILARRMLSTETKERVGSFSDSVR